MTLGVAGNRCRVRSHQREIATVRGGVTHPRVEARARAAAPSGMVLAPAKCATPSWIASAAVAIGRPSSLARKRWPSGAPALTRATSSMNSPSAAPTRASGLRPQVRFCRRQSRGR